MSADRIYLERFIQANLSISSIKAGEIAERFTYKTISKNELFLKEGKVCNEYYFLVDGLVRSYTYNINGDDITTNFYGSNEVASELFSFFKQVPAKENFQALTDCNTWYITFDNLQIAFHSMPGFREFGRSMLVGAYAQLKQRMLSMLHNTAEERYLEMVQSSPDIFQHAPLKNIATFLGITRTSLSRIRKELSKK